jgi:hypothetical protein
LLVFLLASEEQAFTANSAIPNEGIEQMARKNDDASDKAIPTRTLKRCIDLPKWSGLGATSNSLKPGPLTFSLAMFEHACAYRDVYRAMLGGQGSTIAINEIRRVLAELVKEDLSELRDDVAVPRELMLQFVVATFLTALTWCLEKRPKLAPSEINDMFRHLVTRGIGRAIVANGR